MGDDGYKPWWAIDKAAWREALAPFYKFASIADRRDTPLPPWSEADVQEFINSDPVYGPQLKLVRSSAYPFLHVSVCTSWRGLGFHFHNWLQNHRGLSFCRSIVSLLLSLCFFS